jgi:adenine-specific DNA-methyltransferase
MPVALKSVIDALDARILVASCSDEGWVTMEDLREWCAPRGHIEVLGFDSRRYVGAQIGVFNPQGERVGEPTRMRNVEYLVLCGERALVERCSAAVSEAGATDRVH